MLLCAAGMVSALIAEDEPDDVKLIDDAILSTAANDLHHQDNTASVDKRRRRSAPSDALVDSRRRHPLLPRMSVLDVLLV